MSPLTTPEDRRKQSAPPLPRRKTLWRTLLLAALALANLACVTVGTSLMVVQREGQEDQVTVSTWRTMSDEYIEAAKRANAERAADYRAAGREVPDGGFAESAQAAQEKLWSDMETLQGKGYQFTEGPNGLTATANFTLAEYQDMTADGDLSLQVDRSQPEGVYYSVELKMPATLFASGEMSQALEQDLGPKPPLEPIDRDSVEKGSLTEGLISILESAKMGTTALDVWYLRRILVEAGLPTAEYVIELPGEIVVHEIDGAEAGYVDGNRVTLIADKELAHMFGPAEHTYRVVSLVGVCGETCSQHPNMVWDGISEYPECTCICQKGWEMGPEGCVDCQTLCQQVVPPAEYDPANSLKNECRCRPLPDRDLDGIPDDRDDCPDDPGATQNGCPESGDVAVAPDPGGEQAGVSPPDPGTEGDQPKPPPASDTGGEGASSSPPTASQGAQGPTAGQAAAGAVATSVLLATWAGVNLLSGTTKGPPVQTSAVPGPVSRPPPSQPPAQPHALPSVDPQLLQQLGDRFQAMVDHQITQGYYVMNPDGVRKTWNWPIGGVINYGLGYHGGQCGEFAAWGADWSKGFIKELFGPGAIVDTIYIQEQSTEKPDGIVDWFDSFYQANHAATRVLLPTGESYVLDYWAAVKERQGDPVGDLVHDQLWGGSRPRRDAQLVPEKEWVKKWTERIGKDDAIAFNLHPAQRNFRECLEKSSTFEEAVARFRAMRPMLRGISDDQIEMIINNWRRSP